MSGDDKDQKNKEKDNEKAVDAEIVDEGSSAPTKNMLNDLKPEHRNVLNDLIARGFGARRCRKHMMKIFQDDPEVLKIVSAHANTYNTYIQTNRDKIMKVLATQREVSSDMEAALQDMEILTKMDETPLTNTKAVLENIYKRCSQQVKLITLKQNNFLDPLWGKLLLEYSKEQGNLALKALEFKNEMDKDLESRILDELETFMTMILSSCVEAFRKHGDQAKFSQFETELIDKLKLQLKNYKDARQKQIAKHKGV